MEKLPDSIMRDGKEFWYGTEENPFNAHVINTPLGEDTDMIRYDTDIRSDFPHLVEKWRGQSADEQPTSPLP